MEQAKEQRLKEDELKVEIIDPNYEARQAEEKVSSLGCCHSRTFFPVR